MGKFCGRKFAIAAAKNHDDSVICLSVLVYMAVGMQNLGHLKLKKSVQCMPLAACIFCCFPHDPVDEVEKFS